jgi:hypothetical protein
VVDLADAGPWLVLEQLHALLFKRLGRGLGVSALSAIQRITQPSQRRPHSQHSVVDPRRLGEREHDEVDARLGLEYLLHDSPSRVPCSGAKTSLMRILASWNSVSRGSWITEGVGISWRASKPASSRSEPHHFPLLLPLTSLFLRNGSVRVP